MRKTCSAIAVTLLCLFAPLTARAVPPPLISCPPSVNGGDNLGSRAFYVPRYPGSTLRDVTIHVLFPASGSFSLSLTARRDSFDGTLLGTATTVMNVTGDRELPVTFQFPNVAVPPGSTVTFDPDVAGPPFPSLGVYTATGCPVVETNDTNPPLSTFRRAGMAITINGDPDPLGPLKTITIPAVASIHGRNETFFHSDVNLFYKGGGSIPVTASYRCYAGQSCSSRPVTFTVDTVKSIPDIVATLFGAPESAGAIELSYRSPFNLEDYLYATSRVYTPALPNPTNGAVVAGYPESVATGEAFFVGLGNNGGNLASGFRTNAGVYNPWGREARVSFVLRTVNGTDLGTLSQTWGPHEARQINDIFAAAGSAGVVTTDAILFVSSDLPVFPYVTVIDNVTGDSVVQGPTTVF